MEVYFFYLFLVYLFSFLFTSNFKRSFFSELDKKNLKYTSEHVLAQMAILVWMVYF